MTCEDALLLLSGHLDQCNTDEETCVLQEHLRQCEHCRALLQELERQDKKLKELWAEQPQHIRENVMNQIKPETTVRKQKKRAWFSIAAAAAMLALLSGVGFLSLPNAAENGQIPAPAAMRALPEEAAASAETMILSAGDAAAYDTLVLDAQEMADRLGADLIVIETVFPELEACETKTLGDGSILYTLLEKDDAVQLSRVYGVALYQPTEYGNLKCSYAWLQP